MPFCPDCKSMVYPNPQTKSLHCRKCDKEVPRDAVGGTKRVTQKVEEKEMLVIDENSRTIETRGMVDVECPKCGNGKAYADFRQTRRSDEPPTMFCECVECAHRWRQY